MRSVSPDQVEDGALVWTCQVCGEPVADGDGYVCVSYRELHEHEEKAREWEEEHAGVFAVPFGEFLTYPEQVRWRVLHRACDPDPDSPDYWIDIARVRTPSDVIARTAHLLGKKWLQVTDWDALLRTVEGQLERRAA